MFPVKIMLKGKEPTLTLKPEATDGAAFAVTFSCFRETMTNEVNSRRLCLVDLGAQENLCDKLRFWCCFTKTPFIMIVISTKESETSETSS